SRPPVRHTATAKRTVTTRTASAAPRPVTHKTTTVTRTTTAAPAAAAAPAPAATTRPAPVVDMTAKPATPAPPAKAKPANNGNETALELGGGALALLALGGAAFAVSRRRRRHAEEEEWYGDETVEHEHAEPAAAIEPVPAAMIPEPRHDPVHEQTPGMVAPAMSAFAWGNEQPCDEPSDDGSDRCPGETWVERAHRGPSPANPSVSLKNR